MPAALKRCHQCLVFAKVSQIPRTDPCSRAHEGRLSLYSQVERTAEETLVGDASGIVFCGGRSAIARMDASLLLI